MNANNSQDRLSARLSPGSECAPWVIDAVVDLEKRLGDAAQERDALKLELSIAGAYCEELSRKISEFAGREIELEDEVMRLRASLKSVTEVMNSRIDAIGRAIGQDSQTIAEDPGFARQIISEAFRRGAEEMREACAARIGSDTMLMGSVRSHFEGALRDLPIPKDRS